MGLVLQGATEIVEDRGLSYDFFYKSCEFVPHAGCGEQ